jgi:hypothetical protein
MNGATSGAKAGTTLSSNIEHGPGAPNIERPSVIEDARLYPEVGHLSVQPPCTALSFVSKSLPGYWLGFCGADFLQLHAS